MTVYVIDLEPIETRYTSQWKEHVPEQIKNNVTNDVVVVDGSNIPSSTTPGMFLDFANTNIYKSSQMVKIAELFSKNQVTDGDYFLYTDAWNPTIIQLRYMADLLGIDIRIGGLWHAGAYDIFDGLGRLAGDKDWVHHSELALVHAIDDNFFATDFHIELFLKNRMGIAARDGDFEREKIVKTGWPMEYMEEVLADYLDGEKENLVVFPHRIAPEKNVEVFRELAKKLPQYQFVICQEHELTKHEYHNILSRAKVVFSANLQETLGISTGIEGPLTGAIPIVPDRLSYSEMMPDPFKYESDRDHDIEYLAGKVTDAIENYDSYREVLKSHKQVLIDQFFSGTEMYKRIKEGHKKNEG